VHGCEPETWADGAVRMQPPLAHVSVPARLQFAHQHQFLTLDVHGHAEEISRVRAGVEDGAGGRGAQGETWRAIYAICLEHALLFLPVAVWTTGVVLILDVDDWDVGAV